VEHLTGSVVAAEIVSATRPHTQPDRGSDWAFAALLRTEAAGKNLPHPRQCRTLRHG
jgi:hypothetical protein